MRNVVAPKLEAGRILNGAMGSGPEDGLMGAFCIIGPKCAELRIISSGPDKESGWEHVSVSLSYRTPNWDEMCYVKELFWDAEELVVQFHPPRSRYVNCHPFCLHLWRPVDGHILLPDAMLVGPMEKADADHPDVSVR